MPAYRSASHFISVLASGPGCALALCPVPAATASPPMGRDTRRRKAKAKTRRQKANAALVVGDVIRESNGNGLDTVALSQMSTVPEIMQWCLRRLYGQLRFAASQADGVEADKFWRYKVDAQGNILASPNKWTRLELELSDKVVNITRHMAALGIMERQVQLDEAKTALVITAVRNAALAAGVSEDQLSAMGQQLRAQLAPGVAAAGE